MPNTKKKAGNYPEFLKGAVSGLAIGLLFFIFLPRLNSFKNPEPLGKITPSPDAKVNTAVIEKKVLPVEFNLGVSFGQTVKKMVDNGSIDKKKFLDLYQSRGGLPENLSVLLTSVSAEKIVVTAENSGIILNLLWPLGIANKTGLLADGPMAKDPAQYASTGGWTLGSVDGGKLFNRFPILPLNKEQEKTVTEISKNIYRPCCGNSTYFPDCNHGAAMLGFIELAVSQGMSEGEIYKKALILNSYWFPQTYVELATYFKTQKNLDWDKVSPKEILSSNFSSGQGYASVNNELQSKGLIPKVEGGGGCGV